MAAYPDEQRAITSHLFHRPPKALAAGSPSHITPDTIAEFVEALHAIPTYGANIHQQGEHTALDSTQHIVRLPLSFPPELRIGDVKNHETLLAFERSHSLTVHLQPTAVFNTKKRLAVFDMDSTLIQQEVIDLLAAKAGPEAQARVSQITARAMNGELDFSESLRERVRTLKGLQVPLLYEETQDLLTFTPGAGTLVGCLKKMGIKTAMLSGGFVPLAKYIGDKLGIDHVHANELAVEEIDGKQYLTGELTAGTVIVDGSRKAQLLEEIAKKEGIKDVAAIVAVGDGANDLPMMWAAGLGVAVNAKAKVQIEAPGRLNGESALEEVLALIGLNAEEVEKLAG